MGKLYQIRCKIFYCKKCIEIFEADHIYTGEKIRFKTFQMWLCLDCFVKLKRTQGSIESALPEFRGIRNSENRRPLDCCNVLLARPIRNKVIYLKHVPLHIYPLSK